MSLTSKRIRNYDYVVALNYYHPHVSGLTDMAKRVAEEMVAKGLTVCVVCQRHDKSLTRFQTINGVDVVRASVLMRVSNGLISVSFPFLIYLYAKRAKLIHLHLPMLESGLISLMLSTPKLVSYQCDFVGPKSFFGKLIEVLIDRSCGSAVKRSEFSVVSSRDYAENSRLKSELSDSIVIAPPLQVRQSSNPSFRKSSGFHYGFLGRVAAEKGLENLVAAFSSVAGPEDQLLIAGSPVSSEGREIYERLEASSTEDSRINLLGFVAEVELADFYASIDAFVFPSINALEAFGIAQAEAKALGIPLVTSDLPGVRTIVDTSDAGVLIRPNDIAALAMGLKKVKKIRRKSPNVGSDTSLQKYSDLVLRLLEHDSND